MFSLRTLFVVVAVAALAAASLFANTFWLISAFVVLILGILCWAFLQRGDALWRGLCVFGTVYLSCAAVPIFRTVSDILPSTALHSLYFEQPLENPFANPVDEPLITARVQEAIWSGKRLLLHCIAALLFGASGGLLVQWNSQRKMGSA